MIAVQLTGGYIIPELKKCSTTCIVFSPITDHAFLKNTTFRPSFPGALRSSISFDASFTSYLVTGASN